MVFCTGFISHVWDAQQHHDARILLPSLTNHPCCHPEVSLCCFPPIEKFLWTGRYGGMMRFGSRCAMRTVYWIFAHFCLKGKNDITWECVHAPNWLFCFGLSEDKPGVCSALCSAEMDRHKSTAMQSRRITGAAQSSLGWSDVAAQLIL